MAGSGRNWAITIPKTSALPQGLSKSFFVSQTEKFMKLSKKKATPPQKKYRNFFGEKNKGVKSLNIVFVKFHSTSKDAWQYGFSRI